MLEHGKRYLTKSGEIVGPIVANARPCEMYPFWCGEFHRTPGGKLYPMCDSPHDIDFSWEVSQTYQPGDEYVGDGWFKRKVQKCYMRAKDWSLQFKETNYADATIEFHCVWTAECPAGYFPLEKLVEIAK